MKNEEEKPDSCKCGNEPSEGPHTCPYAMEVNNSDDLCYCCDDCKYQCGQDI